MRRYLTPAEFAAAKAAALANKKAIADRYNDGETLESLEKSLRVPRRWLRKMLTDQGVTIRNQGVQAENPIRRSTCMQCFTLWKTLDDAVNAADIDTTLRIAEVMYLHANRQHRPPPDDDRP
ncbi:MULTISPECIES: hypothetical protein [Streptomyces]|uniref:hypothetical protein n=1 Tax=Streptomyces TaxID=1883 RepID=UPI0011807489|nr:hypothetical protein [Streptomyces kasugaensis]